MPRLLFKFHHPFLLVVISIIIIPQFIITTESRINHGNFNYINYNEESTNGIETTTQSDGTNSGKIYYYIIGGLLGLTILLLLILFISCWIRAKSNFSSDTSTTQDTVTKQDITTNNNTTTYKDEKFSDWFGMGKKKNNNNNQNNTTVNDEKTRDSTVAPLTRESGYSKYFNSPKK